MKLVTGIARLLRRMLSTTPEPLDRTKLVGIYLTSTNDREGYSPEIQENRTRRNGKYSHHRERA
jgi:hypothetical protein